MTEGSKLMSVLLGVVALCALVAIILSAVTMSRPQSVPTITIGSNPGGGSSSAGGASYGGSAAYGMSSGQNNGGKMWLVAVGHDYGAHEYIDEQGFLRGFTVEIVTEVCRAAGIACRVVWDKYVNCWDSAAGEHSMGGKGLHGKWYDACAGWWQTTGRVQVYDFSMAYMKALPSYFFVKKGDSLDTNNIAGKKIGFMDGWSADEKCIARQKDLTGNVLDKANIKHYSTVKDAVYGLLQRKEVNALFASIDTFDEFTKGGNATMTAVKDRSFPCAIAGSSIMARKDSNFNENWNRGYQIMRENGQLRSLCDKSQLTHKHKGQLLECIV